MRHVRIQTLAATFIYLSALLLSQEAVSAVVKASSKAAMFSDTNLKQFLKANPNGVIYVVSPHMYLSLKGLGEYRAIAQKRGLAFLPLLDPITNTRENGLKVDLHDIKVLQSRDLLARDATQHYPAFLIYKGGVLKGKFNPGYDAPEVFEKRLERFFK